MLTRHCKPLTMINANLPVDVAVFTGELETVIDEVDDTPVVVGTARENNSGSCTLTQSN